MKTLTVIAGPSGSGKNGLAKGIAERIGAQFHDCDDFHDPAGKERVASGTGTLWGDPDDLEAELAYRRRWVKRLTQAVSGWLDDGHLHTLAFSGIRRENRRTLFELDPERIQGVWLDCSYATLERRMSRRPDHFYGVENLPGQWSSIETPDPSEGLLIFPNDSDDLLMQINLLYDLLTKG